MKDELKVTEAENNAGVFAALAAFYNTNPDSGLIDMAKGLRPEDAEDAELRTCIMMIKDYADTLLSTDDESLAGLKRDWTKLFRGIAPNYGPKPPYEQLYTGNTPALLGELASAYSAVRYKGQEVFKNRHDYIGIELDFLAHLEGICAAALRENHQEMYKEYADKADNFLDEHVKSWFPAFYDEAMKHAETDFYKGALGLTKILLEK